MNIIDNFIDTENQFENVLCEENEIEENIIKLTGSQIKNVLFNSDKNNWSMNNSDFGKNLEGKRNVMIVIKNDQNEIFGGFISKEVHQGKFTFDNESCLFSIKKNGKITNKKYPIKKNEYDLKISNDDYKILFGFGLREFGKIGYYTDMCIYKKDYKKRKCECEQRCYEYFGEQKELKKNSRFDVKKIIVYEMEEKNKIKCLSEEILFENKIEEMTGLTIEELIFDSIKNKWNKKNSEFSNILNERSNIVIVIENTFGNVFGGFIKNEIKTKQWTNEGTYLFSLKNNEIRKYYLKRNEKGFYLCSAENDGLFAFGSKNDFFKDICIYKKDYYKNNCY